MYFGVRQLSIRVISICTVKFFQREYYAFALAIFKCASHWVQLDQLAEMATNNEFEAHMPSLRDRVLSFLNRRLTPTGEKALDTFLSLPDVENWNPTNVWGMEVDRIFRFGLPFSIIGENSSAQRHRVKAGKQILGKDEGLAPSDFSEIHAAALLTHWGLRPTFIGTSEDRTPDIACRCSDGALLDVEVVRADQRHDHKKLEVGLANFADTMKPSDIDWNLACFMADASDSQELNDAFYAAMCLEPGRSVGVDGRWKVVAVPLDQCPEFVSQADSFAPDWWPIGAPGYWANSILLGAAVAPSIVVRSLVPIIRYIEPIRRKAERSQGRKDRAFLIAMDSTELPRAHDRLPPELEGFFPQWTHVSGVLIFEERFWSGGEKKAYLYSMHPNPHADISLPADLSRLTREVHIEEFVLSGGH